MSVSDRSGKLQDAFDKALTKVVQSMTFDLFVGCFPALVADKKLDAAALLHPLYVTLITRFVENAQVRAPAATNRRKKRQLTVIFRISQQEFGVIVRERDLAAKLTALDSRTVSAAYASHTHMQHTQHNTG
jgi:hypothetical protein